MDAVHIDITGVRQVGLRFDTFPDALYEDLRQEVEGLSTELFALIKADTPTLTGTLQSEERLRIFADENRVTGYIDIAAAEGKADYAKAAALEYGANRSTKVSSHSMQLDHYWSRRLAEPEEVLVAAYSRTPDIAEHAFERGPLAIMQPQILARLNAAVQKAVAQANA